MGGVCPDFDKGGGASSRSFSVSKMSVYVLAIGTAGEVWWGDTDTLGLAAACEALGLELPACSEGGEGAI